jgi:hypothetical protein
MVPMNEVNREMDEDEIVEAVATALSGFGLAASSQDTGGGISCVVLEHKDGGEIYWGTADVTWGAAITDVNGEHVSSIETTCPSDSQDIAAIAEALLGPSVKNGAVLAKT